MNSAIMQHHDDTVMVPHRYLTSSPDTPIAWRALQVFEPLTFVDDSWEQYNDYVILPSSCRVLSAVQITGMDSVVMQHEL